MTSKLSAGALEAELKFQKLKREEITDLQEMIMARIRKALEG